MIRSGPLLALALIQAPDLVAQRAAVVDVTVVDVVAGRTIPGRTVLIENGRIARVVAADSAVIDSAMLRIDGRDRFLIPGLADLHAHFARPEDFDLYLANGVTTVQLLNAAADLRPWEDSVRRRLRRGPAIELCKGAISSLTDSVAAKAVVAEAAAEGFTCLKFYDDLSIEALRALVGESRRRGIRALGHIPRNLTWQQILLVGPSAVAHAEEFLYSPITTGAAIDTIVTEMAARNIGLITTLTNYDLISRQLIQLPELLRQPNLELYSPVHQRAWTPRFNRYLSLVSRLDAFRRRLAFQRTLIRRLDSAGAPILLGTDAGNNFVLPGYSVHDELDQLVLAGLSPAAALRAATSSAAEALGQAGQWGTVSPGARADLVLIHGDPLRDITNVRLIAGVMQNGVWYPRAQLREWLDRRRAGFEVERRLIATIERSGARAGLDLLAAERRRAGRVPIGVFALNELGWQYARMEKTPRLAEAALLLEANARLFPHDPIAIGSWAEFREERRRSRQTRSP